uniref:VWFD domain-containing protein n=1 Tax=Elaeophora elaphi TaxID=1147741 RepID=A0A0R3S2L9_9BILA
MASMESHEPNDTISLPGPSNIDCVMWNRDIGSTGTIDSGSQPPDYHQIVPTLRSNIDQMRKCISIDLLSASQREANFLRMIDRKAPILYQQSVIENAVRRYECFWLPMQAARPDVRNIPPLDVHWVWHCHMLSPIHYQQDCETICGTMIDHKLLSSDEIQQRYEQSVSIWQSFCGDEPYDFLSSKVNSHEPYQSRSSYDIAAAAQRQRNFNYQISLPHYTSPKFISDAVERYLNFLLLKQTYTDQFLTPCYDFDIVWHTHQVHPHCYLRDCTAIFGWLMKHDDTVNDRNKNSKLLKGEAMTKRLWAAHFQTGFWRRGSMYRGHPAPSFLGFETQELSSINYGQMHIPSITLREIPLQREQVRLKLLYGNKKVTTFNADLTSKQVTKSGFSLVWQPTENSANSSVVKFPFERRNPKELFLELELFDKVFLQKKDVIKLTGLVSLEQLLPLPNSKVSQGVAQVTVKSHELDGDLKAKVSITTNLSLNRELQLIVGEFVQQELIPDSRLWFLCQSAALNRAGLQSSATIHLATHTLVDSRDGTKYTVQVAHSASLLLSMILVYGWQQRLLCMAHLIGADTLPSKDQLDTNLQFLPHLSAPDERAIAVMNKDGDFAIVKGKWIGFSRKIPGDKEQKAKPGNPGKLQVDAFNLLKNTVQKFEIPGPEGSTFFVIGEAQARLPSKRIQCRSIQTAEHLACVFSVATLFVLCNPDKVRSHSDTNSIAHQCHKWPLTVACGYGKTLLANRHTNSHQDVNEDLDVTAAMIAVCAGSCDDGVCGACGACGSF